MTNVNDIITVLSDYGPLLIHRNDTHIGKKIIETGYWEKDEVLFLAALVGKLYENFEIFSVIDVGANIGTYTVAFSKIFKSKVNIYSFEAQRIVFQQLAGNCAINSLRNVYAFNNVVSDVHLELVRFNTNDYSDPINFGGLEIEKAFRSDNDFRNNVVPESAYSIKLDNLDVGLVALIKMDIEGMELKAIVGAENIIRENRPVIFYEYFKTNNEEVLKILKKYNYTVFKLPHANALAVRSELGLELNYEKFDLSLI